MINKKEVEYYLGIAKAVAFKSTCTRRKFGAIIIMNGAIVSAGYNGSARKTINCGKEIPCIKDLYGEGSNTSYSYCPSIHAEQNAIINAARNGVEICGATLFLVPAENASGDRPCYLCRRAMINAGIEDCYYIDKSRNIIHEDIEYWVELEDLWMKKQLMEQG